MSIPDGFLIVYFIVILNFLFGKLKDFSCHVKTLFDEYIFARHFLNMLCVFFLIVIFTRTNPIAPPLLVLATVAMYSFFLLIVRCDYKFLIVFLLIVTIVFYLEAHKNYVIKDLKEPEKNQVKENIETYQLILQVVSAVSVILGVIVYIGQHEREYGKQWSWQKFWMGVKKCSGNGSIEKDILTDLKDGVKRILKFR